MRSCMNHMIILMLLSWSYLLRGVASLFGLKPPQMQLFMNRMINRNSGGLPLATAGRHRRSRCSRHSQK